MEQNLAIITKRVRKSIQILYSMLRNGLSKGKLWADLATLIKRGKIAGKAAFQNLMFHHLHTSSSSRRSSGEYEFSCRSSPYIFGLSAGRERRNPGGAPPTLDGLVMEIILSAGASPAIPGFGPSPLVKVKQLRITDSPFPIVDLEKDSRVDEAAAEFIAKFYNDLKRQNSMAY